MRQLETSALNNQNIAAYLLAHTYTADADRAIFARIHIDQVAGGGDYSAYVTIQAAGAGSHFMEGPITTFTVPAAQTAVGFVSILLPVNNADVVKFYIKGLAGDTATPDIVTRIFELTYLRPTTAGRTLDVTDTGEAGIDLANIHEPTTAVDLSGVTIKGLNDPVDLVSTLKHKAGSSGYDRMTDSLEALGEIDIQLSSVHGSGRWGAGNGGTKSLIYTVTDAVSGAAEEGVTVELYANSARSGEPIDKQVTDVFGQVTFNNLVAGTYYLKNIKAGHVTSLDTEVVT